MYEIRDETGSSRGLFHISHLKSYLNEGKVIQLDARRLELAGSNEKGTRLVGKPENPQIIRKH
jgi:hypothetical protein